MKTDAIGLYVHIPFCVRKCNYCDFCSFSGLSKKTRKNYIAQMISEIQSYKREEKIAVDSIFFGGGTPSLLSASEFFDIHDAIKSTFEILPDCEFSVEVNPGTVNREIVDAFVSRGVNRISIGLQTIHENERKILGRIHDYSDFKHSVALVRDAGIDNISFDIMYAIPEQTVLSLALTLDAVLALSPDHISAYSLIVEEGTPLFDIKDSLVRADEDEEYAMYTLITNRLSSAGYKHYEISNYAKSGKECRHNLKYWQNSEYIGVGISAYSNFGSVRYGNTKNMEEYLSSDYINFVTREVTDCEAFAYEYAMLGLRLGEGISIIKYKELSGIDLLKEKGELIDKYVSLGYLKLSDGILSMTERGFYVSNLILTELL